MIRWLRKKLMASVLSAALHEFHQTQSEVYEAADVEDRAYSLGVCDGISQVIEFIDRSMVPDNQAATFEFVPNEECTCETCAPEFLTPAQL